MGWLESGLVDVFVFPVEYQGKQVCVANLAALCVDHGDRDEIQTLYNMDRFKGIASVVHPTLQTTLNSIIPESKLQSGRLARLKIMDVLTYYHIILQTGAEWEP